MIPARNWLEAKAAHESGEHVRKRVKHQDVDNWFPIWEDDLNSEPHVMDSCYTFGIVEPEDDDNWIDFDKGLDEETG